MLSNKDIFIFELTYSMYRGDYLKELLKKLSEAPGVSGHENTIKQLIKNEINGHVDEIREDSYGKFNYN